MPPTLLHRSEAFAEDLIDLVGPIDLADAPPPPPPPSLSPAPERRRPWTLAAWPALVAALGGCSLIAFGLPI